MLIRVHICQISSSNIGVPCYDVCYNKAHATDHNNQCPLRRRLWPKYPFLWRQRSQFPISINFAILHDGANPTVSISVRALSFASIARCKDGHHRPLRAGLRDGLPTGPTCPSTCRASIRSERRRSISHWPFGC